MSHAVVGILVTGMLLCGSPAFPPRLDPPCGQTLSPGGPLRSGSVELNDDEPLAFAGRDRDGQEAPVGETADVILWDEQPARTGGSHLIPHGAGGTQASTG